MIFVTLGSQKFQFDRLLNQVDKLIENGIITENVYAQTGASNYKPIHYEGTAFMDGNDFKQKMEESDLVITHGGSGAIMGAAKKGKKIIAVPRLEKYGEHVDDHQLQLIKQFEEMGIIVACYDVDDLEQAYEKVQQVEFKKYCSNTERIVESLDRFLEGDRG